MSGISGIYQAVDASLAQKLKFDTISNNLANINSNAFKRDIVSFDKALAIKNASTTDFTPGPIHYTGNELDVALGDHGFFKIQTPKGIRYSRNGSFTCNMDSVLVTQNGDPVLGQNGPIKINGTDVSIKSNGQVVVDGQPVDRVVVVDFRQPLLLKKEGGSFYMYQGEEQDIVTAENITVQQGYIEKSNVNVTEEMIKMVETLRAFESVQKVIQTMDELNGKMVNDVGLLQ
ncbi:MAG: flagellar hook-basal body protein [Deltaproteobacteria bacterium]|nr:flagellar hook-basal body protein [Deltaproteobacteria bacterium]MBW2001253.1 flagellar hook-basal body protein [Deltaproteobacteria bacterium]